MCALCIAHRAVFRSLSAFPSLSLVSARLDYYAFEIRLELNNQLLSDLWGKCRSIVTSMGHFEVGSHRSRRRQCCWSVLKILFVHNPRQLLVDSHQPFRFQFDSTSDRFAGYCMMRTRSDQHTHVINSTKCVRFWAIGMKCGVSRKSSRNFACGIFRSSEVCQFERLPTKIFRRIPHTYEYSKKQLSKRGRKYDEIEINCR